MGKGGQRDGKGGEMIPWSEVEKHNTRDDKWIVIDGEVYDVTQWARKHPGGSRIISHYAGEDATEPFVAFHKNRDFVRKHMPAYRVGKVKPEKLETDAIREDFEELRQKVEKMGMFKPSKVFFLLSIAELIGCELAAFCILTYFGNGWIPYLTALALFVTKEAQGGWIQHDYGHLSVFKSNKLNEWLHQFTMCFTKGASAGWWKHLHNQHHAKPNVISKDPDVRLEAVFVLGKTMPKKIAKEKKSSMPYNWQHRYFFIIGPPLLFPVYFQYMVIKYPYTRKLWKDLAVMSLFYIRFMTLFGYALGLFGMLKFYFIVRILESHWFVWVSQSNHIPMDIEEDAQRPWLELQLAGTCDIERSWFNDWFTGHLNFQIEHHCFPTMPRHNLYKVQPLVQELCRKHGVPYHLKTLGGAFNDIVQSLRHSGEIWAHYYEAYHHE